MCFFEGGGLLTGASARFCVELRKHGLIYYTDDSNGQQVACLKRGPRSPEKAQIYKSIELLSLWGSAGSCSLDTVAAGLKLYRQCPSIDQAEVHVVAALPGEKQL